MCIFETYRSLWRRVLSLENDDSELESVVDLIEESCCDDLLVIEPDDENNRGQDVVSSGANREARKEFLLDHYRRYKKEKSEVTATSTISNVRSSVRNDNSLMGVRERQQLEEPNLDIPIDNGSSYVTLAQ